jgi:hypothetical protein
MADAPAFTKLVPGFDFLQGLVNNANSALPSIGQWVAPTLDPDELGKRIDELRTVQFWLEQNARMLAATIQALEVQRMTLTTLRNMNVQMDDLTESLKIRMPEPAPPAPAPAPAPQAPADAAIKDKAAGPRPASADASTAPLDPMQWWGAITKQFTELATHAMKEGTSDAARNLADAMIKQGASVKQGASAGGAAPAPSRAADAPPRPRARKTAAAPRKRAAPKGGGA